jgi:cell division protein FtsB
MDFHKKGNREFFNDKLLFKVVGIILLFIIFVLIIADFKIYQKKRELMSQISIYQKQIGDIKKSSQTINEEIANSDNIDYLEKLGYEEFNETKPGETEYMFIKPQKKIEVAATPQNGLNIKSWAGWLSGTLSNIWLWIKNKF